MVGSTSGVVEDSQLHPLQDTGQTSQELPEEAQERGMEPHIGRGRRYGRGGFMLSTSKVVHFSC